MERPALKRLLTAIQAKQVDVVVVYKIDRLTRSLADFSRMIEVFEAHGASFVAVTQQFNTTTSMGRLMLNVLLSFAQFEREVTGERIRDKIGASKRKGMWMGGTPPLGYDIKERKLVVNELEAKLVRQIFKRMTETNAASALVKELKAQGATSKTWITQGGKLHAGSLITKTLIYKMLHNRTYLGEIGHQGKWYPGAHSAIVDPETWQAVHGRLQGLTPRPHLNGRETVPFLLKGLLRASTGGTLQPWHTRKKGGRLYRYYLSAREIKEHSGASGLPRYPAQELEDAVINHLLPLLRSDAMIEQITQYATEQDPDLDEAKVTVLLSRFERVWQELFPAEQQRLVHLLVEQVIVHPDQLEIRLRDAAVRALTRELVPMPTEQFVEEAA